MTGSRASVLGVRWEQALEGFRTQMPQRFETADEDLWVNAVVVDVNDRGLADSIEPVLMPVDAEPRPGARVGQAALGVRRVGLAALALRRSLPRPTELLFDLLGGGVVLGLGAELLGLAGGVRLILLRLLFLLRTGSLPCLATSVQGFAPTLYPQRPERLTGCIGPVAPKILAWTAAPPRWVRGTRRPGPPVSTTLPTSTTAAASPASPASTASRATTSSSGRCATSTTSSTAAPRAPTRDRRRRRDPDPAPPRASSARTRASSGSTRAQLPAAGRGRGRRSASFRPTRARARRSERELEQATIADEGQLPLGWRDVPVDPERCGETARERRCRCPPAADRPRAGHRDQDEFERKLFVIRRVTELEARTEISIPSLSSRTIVYKGMLTRAAALRLLRRPARPRAEERARGRPLALLDQHLPELGAGPAAAAARPQRRDQHARRQRQLDARPRGGAALARCSATTSSAACR